MRSRSSPLVSIAFALALAPEAHAAPALELPIACRPGEDCWVANYFDADPLAQASDFRCGPRSYDGHDGVDFALRDLARMHAGVAVRAAADGVVRAARDGMDDVALGAQPAQALAGRECGNGVVLQHGDGWETQYCHLRRGSVRVKPGDRVVAGDGIALVGLSGQTEFPHLHFALRHAGQRLDPFSGAGAAAGCEAPDRPLWRDAARLGYEPVALYNAGFAAGPPDIDAIRAGRRDDGPYAPDTPALVLWVDMFGVRAGDRVRLRIEAPDGSVLLDTWQAVERTQARRFVFAGVRLRTPRWLPGEHVGTVTLRRAGDGVERSLRRTLEVRAVPKPGVAP